jgi:hypothetical protein
MRIQTVCLITALAVVAGCKTTYKEPLSLNQLPAPVQATVQRELNGMPISSIVQEQRYGAITYRIETEKKGRNGVLWVDPNGEVVQESRALVAEKSRISEAAGAQAPARTNAGESLQ